MKGVQQSQDAFAFGEDLALNTGVVFPCHHPTDRLPLPNFSDAVYCLSSKTEQQQLKITNK